MKGRASTPPAAPATAAAAPPPRWLMPLAALLLLPLLAMALWSDSVDLAHHYALVARLVEHWTLPAAPDPSLGEMNVYPRGAHLLGALLGRLAGSPLLGMQLAACGATLLLWCALLALARALPPRAAVLGAAAVAALLLLNRYTVRAELFGAELHSSYFYSQLVAQAAAALVLLTALQMEQRQLPALWRHALLAGGAWLCVSIHLLPALELLAAMPLLALSDWRGPLRAGGAARRPALLRGLLLPAALLALTALLVWRHPAFAIMQSISQHNGQLTTAFLGSRSALGAYAGALALLSLALLWHWRRLAVRGQALAFKYVGALGLAIALLCLAQLGALLLGKGSDYATQKYAFGLNSLMLLELGLLAAVLAGGLGARAAPAAPGAAGPALGLLGALLAPLLLVLASVGMQPARAPVPLAPLVGLEHQLLLLRDLALPGTPQRHSLLSGVPGLSPVQAYLFSIGVFGAPRDQNAGQVLGGAGPTDLRSVDALLTGPHSLPEAPAACRRPLGADRLAVFDGACLDAWYHPPGSRIGLRASDPAPDCTLQGFSPAEQYGRWTMARHASLSCPLPDLHGRRPASMSLLVQAFLDHLPQQRLSVRLNGGAPQEFRFDHPAPRVLSLPLEGLSGPRVTLTLDLPDARAPRALGLNSDARELGILLNTIEFH